MFLTVKKKVQYKGEVRDGCKKNLSCYYVSQSDVELTN